MLLTVAAGATALTLVISIHEFCHLLLAKAHGIKVRRYSIGFGPKLFGFYIGETEYCLSALPFGGYVKLAGHLENPEEQKSESLDRLYFSKNICQRFSVIVAGPASNYLLAILLFTGLAYAVGHPVITSKIGSVLKESPAMKAGIRPGDKIISVDHRSVNQWEEVRKSISSRKAGEPAELVIERDGEHLTVTVRPEIRNQVLIIGIWPGEQIFIDQGNIGKAVKYAASDIYRGTLATFVGIYQMIAGKLSAKENLMGPVGIVNLAGAAAQSGLADFLYLIGWISLAIGFMNFLPIPGLDGFYLALLLLEKVRGRPLSPQVESAILQVGILLLFALFFLIQYFDILRLTTR